MKANQFSSDFVSLLDPLMGGGDDDTEVAKYASLNPNDESSVKAVIRTRLIPAFSRLAGSKQDILKQQIRQHLADPDCDFKGLFYSGLLPFAAPDDAKRFFIWLKDEMDAIRGS